MIRANILALLLGLINIASSTDCGETEFTDSSGRISISNINGFTTCTYKINLRSQYKWIQLEWETFNIDGDMPYCKDYVKVSTGCGISNTVAKFCSNNMVSSTPHKIYSPDGCMKIVLYASSSKSRFSAKYKSGTGTIPGISNYCLKSQSLYSSSGVITSPRWPENFRNRDLPGSVDKECEWDIKRSSNELIQLNFMDVSFSNSYVSYCVGEPYVSYEGDKSLKTSYFPENKYCGKRTPFTRTTDYYEVDIKLEVPYFSSAGNNRGFAVGYVVYKSDASIAALNWVSVVVGLVITFVIIGLVVFICIRMRRRRASMRQGNSNVQNYGTSSPSSTTVTATTTALAEQPAIPNYNKPAYPVQPQNPYAPQQQPYPPQQPAYGPPPPQQQPYPPSQTSYPPQQHPYPPVQTSYPQEQYPMHPPQYSNTQQQEPLLQNPSASNYGAPPPYPGPQATMENKPQTEASAPPM